MYEVIEFRDEKGNITHFGVGKDGVLVLEFGTLTSRDDAEKYVDQENKKESS
jgi:hypothetical protein